MNTANAFMEYALQLAEKGKGFTSPNPMVGCVIVYEDSIIGQGWHQKAGTPHAEVHAINSVKKKHLLSKATLYVTLEPCSHHGRTPPCCLRIIEEGIPNVVIGCLDPNPKVAGKGIRALQEAGCQVTTGVLEEECLKINRAFFTRHTKKRPLVTLKWAESSDGYIAPLKKERNSKEVFWLTEDTAQQKAHQMRAEADVLLVGVQTIIDDDPLLNTRKWQGNSPIPAVIDPNHRMPNTAKVLQQNDALLYFTASLRADLPKKNQIVLPFKETVPEILSHLASQEINSVLVEGGAKTIAAFIASQLWDEAHKFIAPKTLGNGIKAPELQQEFVFKQYLGKDQLWSAANTF